MTRNVLRAAVIAAALVTGSCASSGGADVDMTFSEEPLLGKVIWNDLITENGEAARRFYGEMFGWTFESREAPRGGPYFVARSGDVYVGGILPAARGSADGSISRWLPYVSVEDVDRAAERATRAGAEIVVSPRDVKLGRIAALVDPEGAVIGLASSDVGDPDDATTAPAVGRITWHELLSDAPAEAAEFYRTVAGYERRTVDRRGGEYRMLSHAGVDRLGILANPTETWDPVWLTHFGVEDAASAATKAETLGARILVPVSPELREGTTAVLQDPTGAIFVISELSNQGG